MDYRKYVDAGVTTNFFKKSAVNDDTLTHAIQKEMTTYNISNDFKFLYHEIFNPPTLTIIGQSQGMTVPVANIYRAFWLSSFGYCSRVPADQFLYHLHI